jgi:peptide subunit release factor 1 (eRF1)
MIHLWREELRELAAVDSAKGTAITFYYQPVTPQDRTHRQEAILVKDLIREARKSMTRGANDPRALAALDRIFATVEHLRGNHSRAKAIFACPEQDFWRTFDIPGSVGRTQMHINRRFHLKPLAEAVLDQPHCCVLLLDRERAVILDLYMGHISERERILDVIPRRARSDGFMGYDAGHIERHVDQEALRHFKKVADRLREVHARGDMEALVVGCRADVWTTFSPCLHPYVREKSIGRFDVDTALISKIQAKKEAIRLLTENRHRLNHAMVREVLDQARANGRGSRGLRHVMISLERGEVQALLMGREFTARAVECRHCGHLDTRLVKACAVCGHPVVEIEDVADALIGKALRLGVEIHYVTDEEFAQYGNIGALLRFRADRNTAEMLAG